MNTSWHRAPLEGTELAGFTIRARKAFQLANQEAHRLSHDYSGTEHLLLGLVKDGGGVASQVLKELGFTKMKARALVERVAPPNSHQPTTGTLPRNADAKKALDSALQEAKNLNHPRMGTGHILLGLISLPDTTCQRVLAESGLRPKVVREKVLAGLRHPNYDRIESIVCLKASEGVPDFLLLYPRSTRRAAWAVMRDVFWSLPIGVVVGLLTQSWIAFAVTFVLVVVGYTCRRSYLDR